MNANLIRNKLRYLNNMPIKLFDQIGSTYDYCKDEHLIGPELVVANYQTNGHGQFDHSFYSPKDSGIYMTIILPVQKRFIANPGLLTAGTGVSVIEAIHAISGKNLDLKWINDIYQNNHKCGGVLVETNTDDENKIESFLVGIGLNVYPHHFPAEVRQRAGSIFNQVKYSRNDIIAAICNYFYQFYYQENVDEIWRLYKNHMIWLHQSVRLNDNGRQLNGIITDVDHNFHLILKDSNGKKHVLNSKYANHLRLNNKF